VDSIEGITHSLCSKEFEVRRESYFWLLDMLGLRKPLVYEFSRFNVKGLNLSKRYLKAAVEDGSAASWEDPAMPTICGLRNRGYTPSSILKFCSLSGVTKVDSELDIKKFNHIISDELNLSVERRVVITNPLKVKILDFDKLTDDDKHSTFYDYPMYMRSIMNGEYVEDIYRGIRNYDLTEEIYIERSDFREEDDKKYYGFSLDKIVRLRYNGFFKCEHIIKDKENGDIEMILVRKVKPEKPKKVKGVLLWLPSTAVQIDLNIYEHGSYDHKIVKTLGETKLNESKRGIRYQFEKVGYFMTTNANTYECIMDLKSSY
jgi:glutaminyl-tRNA synthetase